MQAHIIITGFVQGVGYRKFVRHQARNLGLTGWVRNIPSGEVEALIVGDETTINKLLKSCKKGPFLSQVDNMHVEWEEIGEKFDEFVIRHD